MEKFSEVLKRGGLGRKYDVSAGVTMQYEQKFNVTFTVIALNKEQALTEASKILEQADYIKAVHNMFEPIEKSI